MARQGDKERVLQLLQGGCPANSADYDGRTAIHLAAAFNNMQALKVLLEAGANPNSTDRWGRTPLADCVKEGHAEVAHALIEAGGQLLWDENTSSGELCELARGGDIEKIKLLLAGSCDPNAADYDKRTCLHLAASGGNLTVAEALCKHPKIDVNAKDRWDGTALADAVRCLHPPPALVLHEYHSTTSAAYPFPGARARQGGAAAARQRRKDVPRAGDHLRLSELAREGKLERMQTLVSFGCDVNAVDYDARTPLHAASGEGNVHILSYLLLQNADVNAVDHRGCTPLDEAVRTNHHLVAQRLREAGAQVRPSAFNRRILTPQLTFPPAGSFCDGRGRAAR